MVINAGIVGATGYTGEELIALLLGHPGVRISYLAAKVEKPQPIDELFPKFKNRLGLACDNFNITRAKSAKCSVFFLALPHGVSIKIAPCLLKDNLRVIDLSADYRLKNAKNYDKFYNFTHADRENLKKAVYGLPEFYRSKIKAAKLVANPGCYPTAALLALAPLFCCEVADFGQILIDAKSGATGAGRRAQLEFNFSEVNEDVFAYKINAHQHMPEINQELSKLAGRPESAVFVPHLLPLNRGILETIYLRAPESKLPASAALIKLYNNFYKKEPFIRIKNDGQAVRVKDVLHSNFCDIGIKSFPAENLLVISAAIDNLGKGAAGQAIQNMNIMFGFPEDTALK